MSRSPQLVKVSHTPRSTRRYVRPAVARRLRCARQPSCRSASITSVAGSECSKRQKLKTIKGGGRSHSFFFLPSPYATDPRGGRFACHPLDVPDTLQSKHEYARCAREGQGDWFKSSLPLYRLCPLSCIPHCGCSAITCLYAYILPLRPAKNTHSFPIIFRKTDHRETTNRDKPATKC